MARSVGSKPTLGTIFSIFITPTPQHWGHDQDPVQATCDMVAEPTLGMYTVMHYLYVIVSIKQLREANHFTRLTIPGG